jgi:hypothetical protein
MCVCSREHVRISLGSIKQDVMKTLGRVEVYIQAFLISALKGGKWSVSHSSCFTPWKKATRFPLDLRGWGGGAQAQQFWRRGNLSPLTGNELRFLGCTALSVLNIPNKLSRHSIRIGEAKILWKSHKQLKMDQYFVDARCVFTRRARLISFWCFTVCPKNLQARHTTIGIKLKLKKINCCYLPVMLMLNYLGAFGHFLCNTS